MDAIEYCKELINKLKDICGYPDRPLNYAAITENEVQGVAQGMVQLKDYWVALGCAMAEIIKELDRLDGYRTIKTRYLYPHSKIEHLAYNAKKWRVRKKNLRRLGWL